MAARREATLQKKAEEEAKRKAEAEKKKKIEDQRRKMEKEKADAAAAALNRSKLNKSTVSCGPIYPLGQRADFYCVNLHRPYLL